MINYNILHDSIEYYSKNGFQRIEVPWTVSPAVSAITKPIDKQDWIIQHNNKSLIASGEQGFLYLYLKNFLPKGKFQTITPCFRDESFDYLHSKYFIKNELIITDTVNKTELNNVISTAFSFFCKYLDKNDLNVVEENGCIDIKYKDIELGSYGIRECEFLKWIFATGVAEPRLSNTINIAKCI